MGVGLEGNFYPEQDLRHGSCREEHVQAKYTEIKVFIK